VNLYYIMGRFKTALLVLSLSLVAAIPFGLQSKENDLAQVLPQNGVDEKVIDEVELPEITNEKPLVQNLEESGETFTGPPSEDVSRKLLEIKPINTLNTDEEADEDLEEEENLDNEDSENELSETKANSRNLLSVESEEADLEGEESNMSTNSRKLLGRGRRLKRAVRRVAHHVKKIFHGRRGNGGGRGSSPAPASRSRGNSVSKNKGNHKGKNIKRNGKKHNKRRRICKGKKCLKRRRCRGKKCIRRRRCKGKKCKRSRGGFGTVAGTASVIAAANNIHPDFAKLSTATKAAIGANDNKLNVWLNTDVGKDATDFCVSLGILNKPRIFKACLEDMMVLRDKKIAKEAALTAEEFLAKDSVSKSKRFCTASGDPHFTNYDGAYFHLQEPGVYTLAKTSGFEVQERMRKNGPNRPGVPSCLTGASVRFGDVRIEADVSNYNSIYVNGAAVSLPRDYTINFGGVKIRYGTPTVEWKGERSRATGLKISGRNGFAVMIQGGYCGVVEVNVPENYFGKMSGICGNADGRRDSGDFRAPDGGVMNVRYGARSWEMSGYGGPSAPLSRWQLVWKPTGPDCFFTSGCEPDSPAVAAARAKEAERIRKIEDEKKKAEEAARRAEREARRAKRRAEREKRKAERKKKEEEARKKEEEAKRLAEAAKKAEEDARQREREAKQKEQARIAEDARQREREAARKAEEAAKTQTSSSSSSSFTFDKTIVKRTDNGQIITAIKSGHELSQKKLDELSRSVLKILEDAKAREISELRTSLDSVESSKTNVNDIYKKYLSKLSNVKVLKAKIDLLKKTIKQHYEQMKSDSEYLKKLELIKPRFLKTLDNYNSKANKVRLLLKQHILEGTDKNNMLGLLGEVDSKTQSSTDKLSKAFLEHYEKYKNMINKEKSTYDSEVSQLSAETTIYEKERRERKDLHLQYKKGLEVLEKLKSTYSLSSQDAKDFDILGKIIKILFKNPARINQFIKGNVNEGCATTLLQSHVANNLI